MLFTEIEFKKYAPKIKEIFGSFKDRDEFETYLQNKLNTNNLKIYISNILRAVNIVLGNNTNKYINEIDDLEILVKLNLKDNKDNLLEYVNDEAVKRYLKDVDSEKLDILIKLSSILDDIETKKVILPKKVAKEKIISNDFNNQKKLENKDFLKEKIVLFLLIALIVIIAIYKMFDSKEDIKVNEENKTKVNIVLEKKGDLINNESIK